MRCSEAEGKKNALAILELWAARGLSARRPARPELEEGTTPMRNIVSCSTRSAIVAALLLLLAAPTAYAGGFYLSQVGTPSSVGTAGAANVTNRWGADAAFTNPAGMTGLEGNVVFSGTAAPHPQDGV